MCWEQTDILMLLIFRAIQRAHSEVVLRKCLQQLWYMLIKAFLHVCRAKMDGPYDSRLLPVLLAVILMVALLIVFSGAVAETAGWT